MSQHASHLHPHMLITTLRCPMECFVVSGACWGEFCSTLLFCVAQSPCMHVYVRAGPPSCWSFHQLEVRSGADTDSNPTPAGLLLHVSCSHATTDYTCCFKVGEVWQSAHQGQRVGQGLLEVFVHQGGAPCSSTACWPQHPIMVVRL